MYHKVLTQHVKLLPTEWAAAGVQLKYLALLSTNIAEHEVLRCGISF